MMNWHGFANLPSGPFFQSSWIYPVIFLLGAWELVWKGLGLWRAARNNDTWWFLAIFVFNTVGILPIFYLYVFGAKTPREDGK